MPKQGILHDYDLAANREEAARGQACATCDVSPVTYQWSDYHGEAMCTRCGTPYQLRAGGETREAEGDYPYLNLRPEWAAALREYWQETERFACLGRMFLAPAPGLREFYAWVEKRHPELLEGSAAEQEG